MLHLHDTRAVTSLVLLLAIGCDDGGKSTGGEPDSGAESGVEPAPIEVEGIWQNDFEGVETVTNTAWTLEYAGEDGPQTSEEAVVAYDNDANWAITQNPTDAEFFAGLYNRRVWTEIQGGSFWVCTVAFGLASEQVAQDYADAPDASDPAAGGCGGFAWTKLMPKPQ